MTLIVERVHRKAEAAPRISTGTLSVRDLDVAFGGHEVVRGVSFSIAAGETLVLLGESGSGKSVTARSILRLYGAAAATSGSIRLDEVELLALAEPQMRRLRGGAIAFVPQDATGALDPLRRIGAQITEVIRIHGVETSKKAAAIRAEECLSMVGIPDPRRVARSFPHELSGGMRQRALIAMAVSCAPKVLIADEPTTALDVTIQAQVLELFARLQNEVGMGMLMVTHDVGVARQIADQIAVMYAGRLVETGAGRDVLDDAAHPYTMGLLAAVPSPEVARGSLAAIPGRPPAASELDAPGCAFAPRCPHATDACRSSSPEQMTVVSGHVTACPILAAARCGPQSRVPKEAW